MPGCLVPGCTSGYKSNFEKVHFFTVPQDDELKQKWQIALKRQNTLISKTQVVCVKHFLPGDIIHTRYLLDSAGKVLGVSPYRRPRLIPNAVPSLFPWTEIIPGADESNNISELIPNSPPIDEISSMPEEMETNESVETSNTPDAIKINKFSDLCSSTEKQEITTYCIQVSSNSNALQNFNFSILLSCSMNLPPSWMRNNLTLNGETLISFSFISCEMMNGKYHSFNLKEVIVDSTLKLHTHILEKPLVDSSYISVKDSITSIDELENYIYEIHALKVCKGTAISGLEDCEKTAQLYYDKRNVMRHEKCTLLCFSIQCNVCQNAKRALVKKRKRHESNLVNKKLQGQETHVSSKKTGLGNSYMNKLKQKLNRSVEQKKKLRVANQKLRKNLKNCQRDMSRISEDGVLKQLRDNDIAKNQCDVVQEILKASHCKKSSGRRYSENWLMLCMLLYMRSVSGYNFIRDNNILPLPCVSTMRR
ncbi:uncharacterized protein LOC141538260 [Cotesia typhae]|uniref:uncharacterized protein LOC141538260 n=1 Tax=Cotesia typhae TaxID=2053667 RepID=UPI003D689B34